MNLTAGECDPKLGQDFACLSGGRHRLYLHKVLMPFADAITARLENFDSGARPGSGNRRGGFVLDLEGAPSLFVRHARRGGLIRLVLTDLYLGAAPRPLRELKVTLEARRRGIPAAEPMGAMVEWIAPMAYRGYFITRRIEGMTLWQFLSTTDAPAIRALALDQARHSIDTMHRRGLDHADLNLHNLFVARIGENTPVVMILDLDKARLYSPPLDRALVRSNLARLERSARKLDPIGRYLDPYLLSRLVTVPVGG